MTDEPTFDIELEDVPASDVIMLYGAVGQLMLEAAQARSKPRIIQAGELLNRLVSEHPEATRYILLESDEAEYLHAEFDEEMMAELDLEKVDGEWVDTRDMEDIDVE